MKWPFKYILLMLNSHMLMSLIELVWRGSCSPHYYFLQNVAPDILVPCYFRKIPNRNIHCVICTVKSFHGTESSSSSSLIYHFTAHRCVNPRYFTEAQPIRTGASGPLSQAVEKKVKWASSETVTQTALKIPLELYQTWFSPNWWSGGISVVSDQLKMKEKKGER